MITPQEFNDWKYSKVTKSVFKVLQSEREEYIKNVTSENEIYDSATAGNLGCIRAIDLILSINYFGVSKYLEELEKLNNES